ncbi:MAG: NAD-dependent epimerase/dehydratase family protein [Bacteroidota bacterium]
MQTILGAGGAIGRELAKSLTDYTTDIRLVSRNPAKVNETDQRFSADLTDKDETLKAVEGSEIAYLTIGLPYNHKIWASTWPVIMNNVIEACKLHDCKLVFFDNIYMYDPAYLGNMTEETPLKPVSKKGKVREEILSMLLREVESGNLTALVARCADYYGAGIKQTSMLTETVFNNMAQGKAPNWMGPLDCKHSFTYTPDAAKGTSILGNTPDAYNQVWHLPTAGNTLTGQEWIDTFAKGLNKKPKKAMILSPFMLNLIGLFIPVMKELKEMRYQYEEDYMFISDKFEQRFDFTPTSYVEGIRQIIESDYS